MVPGIGRLVVLSVRRSNRGKASVLRNSGGILLIELYYLRPQIRSYSYPIYYRSFLSTIYVPPFFYVSILFDYLLLDRYLSSLNNCDIPVPSIFNSSPSVRLSAFLSLAHVNLNCSFCTRLSKLLFLYTFICPPGGPKYRIPPSYLGGSQAYFWCLLPTSQFVQILWFFFTMSIGVQG